MSNPESNKFLKEAYTILTYIEEDMKALFGEDYKSNFKQTDKISALLTEDFILSFSHQDYFFYLSFAVDRSGYRIALTMTSVLSHIDKEVLQLIDDSYYDTHKSELVYGHEAVEARTRDILNARGHIKCPMCEKVFEKKYMGNNGVCVICEKNKVDISWH